VVVSINQLIESSRMAAARPRRAPFRFEPALDRAAADPAGTPAVLLRHAARLFAEHGFDGVRTRDVSAAAGVNVSTLHFHWRDKATLWEAVRRDLDRQVLAFFASLDREEARGALTLDEALGSWIRWSLDFLSQSPHLARLQLRWFLEGPDPRRPREVERNAAPFRFVSEMLAARMPPGRAEDASLVVLLMTAAGLVVMSDSPTQQAFLGGSVQRDTALRARLDRFAHGLLGGLIGKEGKR
jgi:AcrR family transcriptional regulator